MKERGMIFNGEMVRALLDGRKTQTRRIMKAQPSEDFTPMNMALEADYKARWYTPGIVDKDGYLQPAGKEVFGVANENEGYSCPFGAVGDRIWVRETWDRYNIDQTATIWHTAQQFLKTGRKAGVGDPQSTCRAGPAASRWKSPTCALSG